MYSACERSAPSEKSGDQMSQLWFTTTLLTFSLTCQYVCVPGCNGLNLHDARLCSLPGAKKREDAQVKTQYNVYQKVEMHNH